MLSLFRDRAPFVLTPDMAYVINDGDKPTSNFQKFTDLCCTAYNELRKHSTLFISLLSLVSVCVYILAFLVLLINIADSARTPSKSNLGQLYYLL